jgi:hypothetical protein
MKRNSIGMLGAILALSGLSNPMINVGGSEDRTSLEDIDFTPKQPPLPKGCKFYWFTKDSNYEDFNFIPQRTPDYVVYKTIASSRKVAFNKFDK